MKQEVTYTVYGIKNCDTVKKALKWLDANEVDYTFHDYKSKGISSSKLKSWISQTGWEPLVNKKGQTWKKLTPEEQDSIRNAASAIALMVEKTSVIKRPLIEGDDNKVIALGFDERAYEEKL